MIVCQTDIEDLWPGEEFADSSDDDSDNGDGDGPDQGEQTIKKEARISPPSCWHQRPPTDAVQLHLTQ